MSRDRPHRGRTQSRSIHRRPTVRWASFVSNGRPASARAPSSLSPTLLLPENDPQRTIPSHIGRAIGASESLRQPGGARRSVVRHHIDQSLQNWQSKELVAMVGIGIVGIGFMGMIHYLAAGKLSGGKVVALCSRDPAKLAGDWTSIQGNFGPRGTQMDLTGLALYNDFAAMLADPQVDLVDLCVPNDQHGGMAIQALRAGKPVLVEKPIALSIDEADA